MARIKLGPMITDIAGSIGGATFQRNRFGMTMRTKPLPKKSETPAQFNIRQKIASLQSSWQDLDNDQRRQWDRYINFSGQTIRRDRSVLLSGQSLYIKYQLFLLLYDQPLLTDLAYVPMPAHPAIKDIYLFMEEAIKLEFTYEVDFYRYFFLFKITSPRLYAQAFNPRGLRFMKVGYQATYLYDITLSYIAAFGVVPPGESYFHYSIQFFSTIAPVFTGVFTGKSILSVY